MPVAQTDIPATVLGYFGVVGDKYNRTSFGMQFLEENQYLKRSTCIQITRCFIGKDYRRVEAADGTILVTVWESRWVPDFKKVISNLM